MWPKLEITLAVLATPEYKSYLEIVKLSVENNELKNKMIKLQSEYDAYRKRAQYDYCHYMA
jgi:uncharacterized coiled-coil DUF342 family protein